MIDLYIIKIARADRSFDYCVYHDQVSAVTDMNLGDELYKVEAKSCEHLGTMKLHLNSDMIEMIK